MEGTEDIRSFLRARLWAQWEHVESDQKRHIPHPPFQKPPPDGAQRVDLVAPRDFTVGDMPVRQAIRQRRSRRTFSSTPLTLEELSFLLWAAQGVREVANSVYRTVPSAGARHPFELYAMVNRVSGVAPGLYRYLSIDHKLCLLRNDVDLLPRLHEASNRQYVEDSAVTFVWTAIPYRTEWRYGVLSPKLIAMDAGHSCQNLYLAVESIGAGMCALGAYHQGKLDAVLEVDGRDEFAVYVATVGKTG